MGRTVSASPEPDRKGVALMAMSYELLILIVLLLLILTIKK